MCKKIEVYKYLRPEISKRVKKSRKKKGLKQLDLVPGNNSYISAIENNRLTKVNNKNTTKAVVRYKNFLPYNIAFQISEALNMPIKELYFGTEKEIEKLVKYVFDKVINSVQVIEFGYDSIKKQYNFPQFKETLIFFERIMRFSADYSYLLHNIRQRNILYIEIDQKILNREEERKKNLKNYNDAYKKGAQYIWEHYSQNIVKSFEELFINDQDEFQCSLLKIDSMVDEWVNKEFYVLLETIYEELLEDTVYNIGYQVDDLAEKILLIDEKELFYYSEDEINFFDDYFKNLLSTDSSDLCGDDDEVRMMNEKLFDVYKKQLGEYSKMKKKTMLDVEYKLELKRINVEKEVGNSLRSAYLDTMRTLVKIQNEALNKEPYA